MGVDNRTAKSKQQIANEYGVCLKTLNKWLREEKVVLKRGLIKPKQLDIIYQKIGFPENS